MFVVCCLWSCVVRCLLFVVCVFVVRCVLLVVYCLLRFVGCLLRLVCCSLVAVRCLLFVVHFWPLAVNR